jgi:hypothetical protein
MVIKFKDFLKIKFPAFLLKSGNWEREDGLLFCDGQLVDDTNQTGKTLGARRMQTPFKNLFPLKQAVYAPQGLVKQSTPYFIDNEGTPFIYEKSLFCPLKYLKIERVDKKGTASRIKVVGHNAFITVPRPPEPGMDWAGILHLHGIPWMLYEYSEEKLKDTRRKV